ncbi:MAG TPA: FAD-dependent oxidoreductase, partial [Verrucomicrobiae bacterium]|nr:FAD-dependent oxidoreductase [Verrucomicrobiae bacterium]
MQTPSNRLARSFSSRTPMLQSVRRLLGIARAANRKDSPPADELLGMAREAAVSRREFLKATSLAAAAVGAGLWLPGCASTPRTGPHAPRIVIVGGGVAGLNAAYKLKKRGWQAAIYEASPRTGGRMYTAKDILNPGLTTELGGEFIDSVHQEMLALAAGFQLELIDVRAPGEEKLVREAFYFEGAHHSEEQTVEAFRPL